MAKKKKALMFADTMNIGTHLPPRLQSYLRGATLEQGRVALKKHRKTKALPATGLQKSEKAFADEYGGASTRRARKRRKR